MSEYEIEITSSVSFDEADIARSASSMVLRVVDNNAGRDHMVM